MGFFLNIFLLTNLVFFSNAELSPHYENIEIDAEGLERQEILTWLSLADSTQVGHALINGIVSNPHDNKVKITHSAKALSVAGRVLFPALYSKLTSGVGVDVDLQMHFFMPELGAHEVLECAGGRIPFTFLENFVHELRHARDAVVGEARLHRFERDALESENALREELGKEGRRCFSRDENHIWQVWFD